MHSDLVESLFPLDRHPCCTSHLIRTLLKFKVFFAKNWSGNTSQNKEKDTTIGADDATLTTQLKGIGWEECSKQKWVSKSWVTQSAAVPTAKNSILPSSGDISFNSRLYLDYTLGKLRVVPIYLWHNRDTKYKTPSPTVYSLQSKAFSLA